MFRVNHFIDFTALSIRPSQRENSFFILNYFDLVQAIDLITSIIIRKLTFYLGVINVHNWHFFLMRFCTGFPFTNLLKGYQRADNVVFLFAPYFKVLSAFVGITYEHRLESAARTTFCLLSTYCILLL